MKTNPNDPAQPLNDFALEKAEQGYGYSTEFAGITKREHFASMAMQGILANSQQCFMSDAEVSDKATELADALIEALNKHGE